MLVEFALQPEGDNTRLRVVETGHVAMDWPDDQKATYAADHAERVGIPPGPPPGSLRIPVTSTAPDDMLWAAIADPSRRRVLDILVAHGATTPTVLAAALPFTRQAVSKHLVVLQQAGLVESRRKRVGRSSTPCAPNASMRPPRR